MKRIKVILSIEHGVDVDFETNAKNEKDLTEEEWDKIYNLAVYDFDPSFDDYDMEIVDIEDEENSKGDE